jgi:hypothetical protein
LFFLYTPYDSERPQPVVARYVIDRTAGGANGRNLLELDSPAPLGTLWLWDGSRTLKLQTRSRQMRVELPNPGELLETFSSSVAFLDRKNVSLRLAPAGQPYRVYLRLSSPEEFTLFDANFPYLREPDGKEYRILVGANPPVPLSVQLTVPRDRDFRLTIEMEYLRPPTEYSVSGRDKSFRSRLTYRSVLDVRT